MAKNGLMSGDIMAKDAVKPILRFQQAGLGTLIGANAAWFESLGDMGAEVARFFAERIKQDVQTQHEILRCRNLAEIQHVQSTFMQNAIDQYQAETGRLVQMGLAVLTTSSKPQS